MSVHPLPENRLDEAELERRLRVVERRERELDQALAAVAAQREQLVAVQAEYARRRDQLIARAREVELERERLRREHADLVADTIAHGRPPETA